MCHAVLAVVSNCCPPLKGRFLTRYSPVRHCPLLKLDESSIRRFSFDLHVLSTPPAFVLSQDQTLYKMVSTQSFLLLLVCLNRSLNVKKFSRIVCVSLFSYQGLLRLSLRQLVYFISSQIVCQVLFSTFFKLFF